MSHTPFFMPSSERLTTLKNKSPLPQDMKKSLLALLILPFIIACNNDGDTPRTAHRSSGTPRRRTVHRAHHYRKR